MVSVKLKAFGGDGDDGRVKSFGIMRLSVNSGEDIYPRADFQIIMVMLCSTSKASYKNLCLKRRNFIFARPRMAFRTLKSRMNCKYLNRRAPYSIVSFVT